MKLNDMKAGDCVCVDGGFTCIRPGLHIVEGDRRGIFLVCDDGKHYLDGQEDEDGADLIGITPCPDYRTTQELRHNLGIEM